MTENLKESLSALMDQEAESFEMRRVLKEMKGEDGYISPAGEELLSSWERYHLISDLAKSNSVSVPSSSFLTGIRAAVDNESLDFSKDEKLTVAQNGKKGLTSIWGQAAIAASVALMVFVSYQSLPTLNSPQSIVDELQLSEATTPLSEELPRFTVLNPGNEFVEGEFNRVVNIQSSLDEQTIGRLQQAVYREFDQEQTLLELPARITQSDPQ